MRLLLGAQAVHAHRCPASPVVALQVWDYNMINHFKGRVQIPLREVIRQRRLQV